MTLEKLTVKKSIGIQVKHWYDRFIFVDILTGYDEHNKPVFSGVKVIPYPPKDIRFGQLFTIIKNPGKSKHQLSG